MRYKTAYFCGNAKAPEVLATGSINRSITLGLLIELDTGIIKDVTVTLITKLAQDLVRDYFINKKIIDDYDEIIENLTFRHVGSATKPMIKAMGDIKRRYIDYMETNGAFIRGETDVKPDWLSHL